MDFFELQVILISLHSNLNWNSVSCSQTIQIQELNWNQKYQNL